MTTGLLISSFVLLFIVIIWWRRSYFSYTDRLEQANDRCGDLNLFLTGFSEILRNQQDTRETASDIAGHIASRLGADSVCIYELVDGEFIAIGAAGDYPLIRNPIPPEIVGRERLEAMNKEKFALNSGLLGSFAAGRKLVMIPEAEHDERFSCFPAWSTLGSVLVLPLEHDGRVLGLVAAVSPQELMKRFDAEQINRMSEMAQLLVLVMFFIKSYAQLRNKVRLDQELAVARQIQSGLLPDSHHEWGRFKVEAVTRSAKEVNGDFYDFVEIDENRLLVVIGDACGKGVPACMLTAMTRSFISSAAWRFDDLTGFLREINNNLYADTDADRFVSLACCLIDRSTGILEFARAGHTELISFINGHIRRFYPDGAALGLLPGELAEFDTICMKCPVNASYLLYSDGINEALNEAGEEFGIRRLASEFESSRREGDSATATIARITDKVEEFALEQNDDQTLIIITCDDPGNE